MLKYSCCNYLCQVLKLKHVSPDESSPARKPGFLAGVVESEQSRNLAFVGQFFIFDISEICVGLQNHLFWF